MIRRCCFFLFFFFSVAQRVPPLRIDDLIEDLKDGTRLLALLEVLSGEKLVMREYFIPLETGTVCRDNRSS